jgi:hypothetical protein
MDWTAARRGYTTQTVLRKGPEWLLSAKPAAAADMPGRLSVTRSGQRLCIATVREIVAPVGAILGSGRFGDPCGGGQQRPSPPLPCRRKRRDDRLSFKGPSQPGNRRCNDLTRITAEAQHQRRLRRCLNVQAAHCPNDDAVLLPYPFDRDV